MIVYYSKKRNKVVGSFPEMFQVPKGGNEQDISIKVFENGNLVESTSDSIDYFFLMPEEAKDFQDPRKTDNIHNCKLKLDKTSKKPIELLNEKNKKIKFIHKESIKDELVKKVKIESSLAIK